MIYKLEASENIIVFESLNNFYKPTPTYIRSHTKLFVDFQWSLIS